jgi:hypothetical protein
VLLSERSSPCVCAYPCAAPSSATKLSYYSELWGNYPLKCTFHVCACQTCVCCCVSALRVYHSITAAPISGAFSNFWLYLVQSHMPISRRIPQHRLWPSQIPDWIAICMCTACQEYICVLYFVFYYTSTSTCHQRAVCASVVSTETHLQLCRPRRCQPEALSSGAAILELPCKLCKLGT